MKGRALVAANLRRLRVAKGLSQVQLAADAGVSRTYLNEVERGLGNATVDVLDQLAGALGCGAWQLLEPALDGPERVPGLRPGRKAKTVSG